MPDGFVSFVCVCVCPSMLGRFDRTCVDCFARVCMPLGAYWVEDGRESAIDDNDDNRDDDDAMVLRKTVSWL